MVTETISAIDKVFDALADPTRRLVVEMLGSGPRKAGELAAAAGMSPPTMSRHLRVLLAAGVVSDERPASDARTRLFHVRLESMLTLQAWLDQLQAQWDEQLESFKHHVERKTKK